MPKKKAAVPSEEERRRQRMMPSEKQRNILEFVRTFRNEHGYPCSRAELARALQTTEPNINHHLSQLSLKGWLTVESHV